MHRFVVCAVLVGCVLGAATFALAQDATPAAAPGAACASPSAAAPAPATSAPEATTGGAPSATPAACGTALVGPTITLLDIAFQPTEFTVPANRPVTVTLHNGGVALHNFSIDALNISQDVLPGTTQTVVITAAAGDYQYYCNIPGHKQAGMVGTLHVR